MSRKHFFVYMLASRRNGTIYIGVTADLASRVSIHREALVPGFTRRYGVHRLVWYEWLENAEPAIRRGSSSRSGTGPGRSASSKR